MLPKQDTVLDKPSKVLDLWETLEKRAQDEHVPDLSYIDALDNNEQFHDEFVRLPFESVGSPDCTWHTD